MFNYSKRYSDRGFTLIELMIAILIVGVLAAMSSPSLLGLLSRYRVHAAINQLEGAIKETQRQAIYLGNICRINVNPDTNIISGNPTQCILSNRIILNEIDIRTNLLGNPPNISFSPKGNTTKMGTIVLSSKNTDLQRCFVIALGTGITRVGKYMGNKLGSVSSTKCMTIK